MDNFPRIEKMTKFYDAASESCAKPGESSTFSCPICGGVAIAKRSSYNGHIHARCSQCGMAVEE